MQIEFYVSEVQVLQTNLVISSIHYNKYQFTESF